MKLLFDLNTTQPNKSGKVHGGGKYAIAVFFELVRRNANMECVYDASLPLRDDLREAIDRNGIPLHDLSSVSLQEVVASRNIDTYYSANTDLRSHVIPGIRNVRTVHGLRELEMPRDWWMLKYRSSLYQSVKYLITLSLYGWWRGVILGRVRRMLLQPGLEFVTVSEHTKYSCLSYLPELKADDVVVCYSPSTSDAPKASKPYTSDYPYILLVSGNRPEKNALRAVVALDEIFDEHPELRHVRVLVTGAKDGCFKYKFHNPANFSMLGYVDEPTLDSLYCGAMMLAYPSLNEGFGYPPVEAMRYGVPVVASSFTSIAEVCDDAAMYCNPLDIKEIKGRLLRMLSDADCRKTYSERGLRRFEEVTRRQNLDLAALADFLTK